MASLSAKIDIPPLILLLENEDDDVFFFRRALSACEFVADLRIVQTAAQARDYLEGKGEFRDRTYYRTPNLIVTDFQMHGQTGVDFIRWIKQQPDYKEIPVAMYSARALPADMTAALESGAAAFFSKSNDFAAVCESVTGMFRLLPPPA